MSALVSQITSLAIACSTVYSVADQRKHQSSASLAFVRGIHRWPVNSPHKGPVTGKMFPFDDVTMVMEELIIFMLDIFCGNIVCDAAVNLRPGRFCEKKNIETEVKWSKFCNTTFPNTFSRFVSSYTEVYYQWSNLQYVIIDSDNVLAPHRRQVITWSNDDPVLWRIYATAGLNKSKYVRVTDDTSLFVSFISTADLCGTPFPTAFITIFYYTLVTLIFLSAISVAE